MSRYRSGEALIFGVATLVALLHALEDAFLHNGPGDGIGRHAVAAAIALAGALAAVRAFPSLRPGLRAALAFSFGALALVNGALHIRYMAANGLAAGHVSGIAVTVAGGVLVGLAATIPWRHRGEGSASRARRWRNRAVAVGAGCFAMLFVVGPIGLAIVDSHKFREPIGAAPSADYRPVTFAAADGVKLAGWYRASRNHASVLVVHGGGSDRKDSVAHARMLARHGYGVLVYDARGSGESEGNQNSYGWGWQKDVAAALDFLSRQDDVDPGRIGALGISTGADVLLRVAPDREDLSAVVTDGAAAGGFEDWRRVRGDIDLGMPPGWLMFKTVQALTGSSPGPALEDQVARMSAPLLIIDTPAEKEFGDLYAQTAGARAERWYLADGHHTAAIREHPREYEQWVVGFLDDALL
jgi:hypothetical protein